MTSISVRDNTTLHKYDRIHPVIPTTRTLQLTHEKRPLNHTWRLLLLRPSRRAALLATVSRVVFNRVQTIFLAPTERNGSSAADRGRRTDARISNARRPRRWRICMQRERWDDIDLHKIGLTSFPEIGNVCSSPMNLDLLQLGTDV